MVAINSIPQQEVAKGSGHNEFERATPMALSNEVAKNPAPSTPGGASTNRISLMIYINKLVSSQWSIVSVNSIHNLTLNLKYPKWFGRLQNTRQIYNKIQCIRYT